MIDENQNEYQNNAGEQNQNSNYSNHSHNSNPSNKVSSELLKHLELIDNENCQLREALTELQIDLKQKDSSIEESNKIITKLKDEYTKLIKEYQNLEKINNELVLEVKHSQNIVDSYNKQNNSINNLQQKNINLTDDINKIRNENVEMKNKILAMNELSWKNEEEIKNKELIVKDLTLRDQNLVEIIKERETLINEQSSKIVELNDIIAQKDEQLKILVNFSKEINKENKNNVKEITKQACDTIKLLNNNKINSPQNNNNFLTDNNKILIKNDKTTFEDFIPLLKQNKTSFSLKDAISSMLFIPKDLDDKIISKEFLMNMNFKTELVKSELFASLIRESQFINFLEDLLDKLNLNNENNKIIKNIGNVQSKLNLVKNKLKELIKENNELKLQKIKLLQNQKDNNLYVGKLKDSVSKGLRRIRDRYKNIGNSNSNVYVKKNDNENKINKVNDNYKYKYNVINNKIPKSPTEKNYGLESTKDFDSNYDKNDYYRNIDSNKNVNDVYKIIPKDNQNNMNIPKNNLNNYTGYNNFSEGKNRTKTAKRHNPQNETGANPENFSLDNKNNSYYEQNDRGRNNCSNNICNFKKCSTSNYDQNNIDNKYYNNQNYINQEYNKDENREKYNNNYNVNNMMKSASLTYFWNENDKNNIRNFSDNNTPDLRKYANTKDKNKYNCSSCSSCSFKNTNFFNNYNLSKGNYS